MSDIKTTVESRWRDRACAMGYKPGTARYKNAECEYFAGAMTALDAALPNENRDHLSRAIPPIWVVNLLSGRPACEPPPKAKPIRAHLDPPVPAFREPGS